MNYNKFFRKKLQKYLDNWKYRSTFAVYYYTNTLL